MNNMSNENIVFNRIKHKNDVFTYNKKSGKTAAMTSYTALLFL